MGPYRVVREIGRGGMGVVYLAERADGHFEQQAAVKLLRRGVGTAGGADPNEARRRFELERDIVASLSHPNIAVLYDGGLVDEEVDEEVDNALGVETRPYSAMEYVDGQPLDVYCDERRLGVAERLRLLETVADAVHFAHRNLVVHRDLKPSNVLVTGEGEVKLLDFGIAKLLDPDTADPDADLEMTQIGKTPLSPEYASPEQLQGTPVTTASDVYQLGLLLFELLTGERGRKDSRTPGSGGPFGLAPLRSPSEAVAAMSPGERERVAAARGTDAKNLVRQLRGDLDAVVAAAVSPRPEERYGSVAELAADLRRRRLGDAIVVRRRSWLERVRHLVTRNRLSTAAATLSLLLLVGYAITVTVQARTLARERDRAQTIQRFALGVFDAGELPMATGRMWGPPHRDFGTGPSEDAWVGRGREAAAVDPEVVGRPKDVGPKLSAAELIERGIGQAELELADEPDLLAEVKLQLGWIFWSLGRHDRAEELYRQALEIQREVFGPRHPEIARTLNWLGKVLMDRDSPETLTVLEEALDQRLEFEGEDDGRVAVIRRDLGFYLRSLGNYEESERYFRQSLDALRRIEAHPLDVAATLRGLGWTVRFAGRPEEAEPMVREALEIYLEEHGEVHSNVAYGWNDLAVVLWQLERWPEGDEAIEHAIEVKRSLYGDAHPDIATSLSNYGGSLQKRGDLEGAVELYRQALDLRRRAFGDNHPRVAQSLARIGEAMHEMGLAAEAEPLLEQSDRIFREHLPENHPSFGRVWRGLGSVRLDLGKLAEARQDLEAARAVYAAVPTANPWPWRVDVLLADVDLGQGRLEQAARRLAAAEEHVQDSPEWLERWREVKARLEGAAPD